MLCIIYKNNEVFKHIETENIEDTRDYFYKLSNTFDDTEWRFERYYGSKKYITFVKNGIYTSELF